MRKTLLGLIIATCLAMSTPALSQTVDCSALNVSSMTTQQIEAAKSFCAAPKSLSAETSNVTPEKVREWGTLGKEFSTAITETARGVGMVANEFLFTPVGILIAFYFMWNMIGGIIFGTLGIICTWILYAFICKKIAYKYLGFDVVSAPVLWGAFTLNKKVHKYAERGNDSESIWFYLAIPALLISASLLILIF